MTTPTDDQTSEPRLPGEKLLYWAVLLVPLERAFTIDAGFPLKISEILIFLAIFTYCISPSHSRAATWRPSSEMFLVTTLIILVSLSTAYRYLRPAPTATLHGFTRGPTTDLLLYAGYAYLVFVAWRLLIKVNYVRLLDALIRSIWVCTATSAMQWYLFATNNTAVLELFNFQTKAKGLAIGGDGDGGATRSGPFVEGQHLGFYAGAILILCIIARRWWSGLAAIACLFYSQSTSGFAGLAVALCAVMLFQPKVNRALRALFALGLAVLVAAAVPALRLILRLQLSKVGLLTPSGGALQSLNVDASRDLRTIKTEIGLHIMADHPLLGVGPGRYGISFFDYPNDGIPNYYYHDNHRAIAENVYAQVGAELGIVALFAFVLFILAMTYRTIVMKSPLLGVAAFTAVGVATQSSWTFLPIWAIFALLTRAWIEHNMANAPPSDKPSACPRNDERVVSWPPTTITKTEVTDNV